MRIILLIFLLFTKLIAQTDSTSVAIVHPHSIYLEIGGNNGIYSINYERMISNKFSARLGFSYLPFTETTNSGDHFNAKSFVIIMPLYFITIYNNNKIGFGVGIVIDSKKINPSFSIGYKYRPANNGFMFHINYTPLFSEDLKKGESWVGIGVGYQL